MASRDEILGFCDELLEIERFDDYGPNGLQVPGAFEVGTVATGVTANLEFLERARELGAELAIAHHGLFYGDSSRALSGPLAARLRAVLCAEISLAGYHLPLDAHPEVGNCALLCEALGLDAAAQRFAEVKGSAIGVIGESADGITAGELVDRVRAATAREPLAFEHGPERVHRVGIVTGAGASTIDEAIALGLDAFVTGEPAEHVMGDAREAGIHFVAGGHYATETFGVRRLGELLSERFGVAHRFVDVPNPI